MPAADVTPPAPPRLAPLVAATAAAQALLVVLAPTILAIGDDLHASVGFVAQARSIAAAVAIVASVALATVVTVPIPRLLAAGSVLAAAACFAVAAAPSLPVFLAAHVLAGLGLACLLSGGFAGVAAFGSAERAEAMGRVAGAQALAWVVVNPVAGLLTERVSWRAAEAVPAAAALVALLLARRAAPIGRGAGSLAAIAASPAARRWLGAELTAYAGWTALLTFVGAFFMQRLGAGEAETGWLLAAGAAAYAAAAARSGPLAARFPLRTIVAGAAVAMGLLAPVLLARPGPLALAAAVFCLMGIAAGVRTPASSSLGLEQAAGAPAAMMAARGATTQAGYLIGALAGGAVIAQAGYGGFAFLLAGGLGLSALLVLRVEGAAVEPVATIDGRCRPRTSSARSTAPRAARATHGGSWTPAGSGASSSDVSWAGTAPR